MSTSLQPRPPVVELKKMVNQLSYLLVGHNHSLSLSNTRKLSHHIEQLKKLIAEANYKEYLLKISDINGLK